MVVKDLEDPGAFLETASSLLLADEARNNLILGIAGTLRHHPSVYDEYRLWLVEDGARSSELHSRHRPTTSCSADRAMTRRSWRSPRRSRPRESSYPVSRVPCRR